MKKEVFELNDHPFIELNKLMKLLGWVETGGDAKLFILNGEVEVNGAVELQIRKKLRANDTVKFDQFQLTIQ